MCAETFAQAHAKLAGRSVSLLDAVDFYLDFHRGSDVQKSLREMVDEYANSRKAKGVKPDHLANVKRQLGRLVKAFHNRTLATLRTLDLDKWLGAQESEPNTKNGVRRICVSFDRGAQANGYLPNNRPTEFSEMLRYQEPPTKVVIYTPPELRTILESSAHRDFDARRGHLWRFVLHDG